MKLSIHNTYGTIRQLRLVLVCIPLWLMVLMPQQLIGQFYHGSNMSFGKNRVQYNDRLWTYYRFENFDTYFYLNGRELALYTAWYANQQIPVMERRLETILSERIQFIIFNNLSELKESNIGLEEEQQYNTGGVTHILGTKVVLYDEGNYLNYERQIRAGIADILLSQIMFGGSIGSQIRNTVLFNLPDWYKNGLISYLSEDWNTTLDNRMRDGINSGRYEKLNRLTGEDAVIAGHSFWQFIEDEHGPSAISNIVQMTQMTRNVQNGFLYATGIRFKDLINNWFTHYAAKYEGLDAMPPQNTYPFRFRDYRTFERPVFSPDEKYLAYATNDEGRIRLWLYDTEADERIRLHRSGYSSDEITDHSYPLLAWHPRGDILAYVVEDKGQIWLNLYNIKEESTQERLMHDFQKITHISYSGNGQLLAMSAVRQGRPNIFVFELASNTHRQITDDFYTDLYPTFVEGTRQIVFSSNRPGDTLHRQEFPGEQPPQFDLFLYDYHKGENVLRRITNTQYANEIKARPYAPGMISYLSDANGFYNLFTARFDSAVNFVDTAVHYRYFVHTEALTHFHSSIIDYDKKRYSHDFALVMLQNNQQKIFKLPASELRQQPETTVEVSPFMQEQLEIIAEKKQAETDTVPELPRRKRFRMVYTDREPEALPDAPAEHMQRQGGFIIDGSRRRSQLIGQDALTGEPEGWFVPKRRNYFVEYFYDELITQVDFTFINQTYQPFSGGGSPIYLNPGFNVFLGVNLNDLMEDYRISGGVRLNTSLTNNEYIISFSNLRDRLDKNIVFHRQSVEENVAEEGINYLKRTHSHSAYYMVNYPFSEIFAVRGSAIYRNDMQVYLSTSQASLDRSNKYENWLGLKGELVFDNSRQLGMNLYTGFRAKAFGEYYQLIDTDSRNMVVLGFDGRYYHRLHRNFIWANRIAGSTSFGKNKLIYYMGGVDNWLLPRFTQETPIDFGQNYAYQTLATNMRGFEQNIRNGNNFVVLNSEFRFPVFSYLMQRPISSEFIRNFQLIAFGDVGTAWTGWNPYDADNSLYTSYVGEPPLTVSVELQKDPLVGGVGFGARTKLLGYFVRGDMAWGIEDGIIQAPIYYISLSLDF